jgi:3-hydroxyisobutyrate dehydrogenase-like beta-hydroxyacid dehydrogenase
MDIGFIGLGQMGFHMARRLVEAGHRVLVFDTQRQAMDRLAALGAHARGSSREIADEVETVMASLPTPEVVLSVATGAGGIIEGKRVRRFVDLPRRERSWRGAFSTHARNATSCRSTAR